VALADLDEGGPAWPLANAVVIEKNNPKIERAKVN
jgi:hypothetical protein